MSQTVSSFVSYGLLSIRKSAAGSSKLSLLNNSTPASRFRSGLRPFFALQLLVHAITLPSAFFLPARLSIMSDDEAPLRPRPQRVFRVNDSSGSSTPAEPSNMDTLTPKEPGSAAISRNGSIMNLTSPTLYGIYSPTAFEGTRDEDSAWGTEADVQPSSPDIPKVQPTLARSRTESAAVLRTRSRLSHGLFRGVILPQTISGALLFAFGVVYGIITIHLHENHWITPVKLEYTHFYGSWEYLGFWGLTGVAIGNVLPWLDSYLGGAAAQEKQSSNDSAELALSWSAVVRSVGAFVGIAFAMVNFPVIWTLSKPKKLTYVSVCYSVAPPGSPQPKHL